MTAAPARPMVAAARWLGAGLVAVVMAGAASASPSFTITGDAVPVGQNLIVSTNANDVVDLYGYQFTLNFDPARLRFATAQEGAFLSRGGTTFFDGGTVDNIAGQVSFVFDSLIGPGSGVSGSGQLASFLFTTLQSGPTTFSLSDVLAVDSTLAIIPVQTAAARLAIPEPTSVAVLLLGLFAMLRVRAKSFSSSRRFASTAWAR